MRVNLVSFSFCSSRVQSPVSVSAPVATSPPNSTKLFNKQMSKGWTFDCFRKSSVKFTQGWFVQITDFSSVVVVVLTALVTTSLRTLLK